MKRLLALMMLVTGVFVAGYAQIGYQVAVIDQSTGEPKANAQVEAKITITDNSGATLYTGVFNEMTNSAGIMSLKVGSDETFSKIEGGKLPLWISATVDGVNLGRTQILSVPVAEYAKKTGVLTKEILMSKTWTCEGTSMSFGSSTCTISHPRMNSSSGSYQIDGNFVIVDFIGGSSDGGKIYYYYESKNVLCTNNATYR